MNEDIKIIVDIASEALARGLKRSAPSVDQRLFLAFNKLAKAKKQYSESDQARFENTLKEKLKAASPEWHFFDSTKPDSDDLSFNFVIFSSLRVAGQKPLAECQFRDNLKGLMGENATNAGDIELIRERVADLESVAKQMSDPKALEFSAPEQSCIVTGVEMAACTEQNRAEKAVKSATVLQKPVKIGSALKFRKPR